MAAVPLQQASGSHVAGERRRTFLTPGLVALGLLSLAGIVALTALGIWQIERRTWKLDLIARVEQRIHAAPVPIPAPDEWVHINARDHEYRRVSVDGRFLHDRETLVQAVTDYGQGAWVLTPLRTVDGITVLINRGFVPAELRDPATRAQGNAEGIVRVTGLMRMSEPKGGFLRTNNSATDRWYSRDVAAIAEARGLKQAAPFFIDSDTTPNAGGWPRGGLTVVSFHNNHLVYALTWFALAFMLAGATIRVARTERRTR